MTNTITEKSIKIFSLFFLLLSNAILFYLAINRNFDSDEYEHLHAAWYVYHGYIPFKDFIEHHNILFMYFLTPLFTIMSEGTAIFFAGRITMFIVNIIVFFLTYIIGSKLFCKSAGYLSTLLLSVTVVFFAASMEIRPDSIQVLFGLISFIYLLKWSETGSVFNMALSGFFFTISLLALQKAIFFFPALVYIILSESKGDKFLKRGISNLFHFACGAIVPFFVLIPYLIYNENFKEYFYYNYLFNTRLIGTYSGSFKIYFPARFTLFEENYLMWFGSLFGLIQLAYTKHPKKHFLFAPIISLLIFLFIAKTPFRQYYMMIMPFIACSAAFFFILLINFFVTPLPQKHKKPIIFLLFIFFVAQPVNSTFYSIIPKDNQNDLQLIQFIIDNSKPNDLVLLRKGNVFRKDTNFNWMWSANDPKFDGIKNTTYDKIISDIQKMKPRIISLNKDFPLPFKNLLLTTYGYTYNAVFDLYVYSEDNFFDKYLNMENMKNQNLNLSGKEIQN